MKKMITMMAVVAMAVSTMHAATFQWGVSGMFYDSKYGWDASSYGVPTPLADVGVQMYLFAIGYNASTSGLDFAYNTDGTTLMVNTASGWVKASEYLNLIDSYVTIQSDADSGIAFPLEQSFIDPVAFFGIDHGLGESFTWTGVNGYTLVMLTITSGLAGDYYNFYAGNLTGFSTAMGSGSKGGLDIGEYDAAAKGLITIIPEPTTAMLALAGIGMLIAQRRKRA